MPRGPYTLNVAQRLTLAFRQAVNFNDVFFHLGYQHFCLPRWFRRLVARTTLHRVWISGYHGYFIGSVCGPEYEAIQ